jgi:hypothetical protein
MSTVGSDVSGAVQGLAKLPLKVADYATLSRPSAEQANATADADEAHKHQVYQQFKDDFHSGHYGRAIWGLTNLFDPSTEDPNDPLQQVMKAQWDSSKQAKDLAVEAVKNHDYAAAVQHAAGVLPVASQVDAAMENYRKDPSRENLAHVVTNALPAFIPALAKGGGLLMRNLADRGMITNPLASTTEDIAGQPVPVRSQVANPTLSGRIAEGLATKEPLQKFDLTQTQPAARAAISKIAEESVTKPSFEALRQAESQGANTITTAFDRETGDILDESGKPVTPAPGQSLDDVIKDQIQKRVDAATVKASEVSKYWDDTLKTTKGDFGQAYRNVKTELARFYQKADLQGMLDGQEGNAFSKAQRDEQAAWRAGDTNAEDAAISRQRELFDAANGDGTYDAVRKMYPKLEAIDKINAKFNTRGVVKNTPSQFVKDLPAGQFDRGIIDGGALRTAIRELKTEGTFAQAGVGDTQVLQLQRLGDLLERSKVLPNMKPVGAMKTIANTFNKMTVGNRLAYLMTHEDALTSLTNYMKSGVAVGGKGFSWQENPALVRGPVSTGVANTMAVMASHRYDETSGQVVPIH